MHITWTGNRFVDFCVGVLELDGLKVDPFDRHEDGNRSLRQLGMDAGTWRAWLVNSLAVRDEMSAATQELHQSIRARGLKSGDSLEREPPWHVMSPADAWVGESSIGTLLRTLWDRQRETGTPVSAGQGRAGWHRWNDHLIDTLSESRELASLGRRVRDLGLRGGSVELFYIDYPGPLVDIPRPDTILLCVREWLPSAEEYVQELVQAIERSQQRGPSTRKVDSERN